MEFSASTKMSGLDTKEHIIRKGAGDAISQYIKEKGGSIPADLNGKVDEISKLGGTP